MIEMGKKYQTRDRREVRIYAVDGEGQLPVHGAIRQRDSGTGHDWTLRKWTAEGRVCVGDSKYEHDLVEVKARIKLVRWLNVHLGGVVTMHASRTSADKWAMVGRAACVRIEIDCEHGEGLEDQRS